MPVTDNVLVPDPVIVYVVGSRVPAVTVSVLDMAVVPPAVKVAPLPFRVRVEYVAAGIVLVPVNIHTPLEALGMDIVPVDTVMVPLLVRVVLTVKPFEPMARVSPVPIERVVAMIAPLAVNVLSLDVESIVNVE